MSNFTSRTAFVTGGANGVGIGLVRALRVNIEAMRHAGYKSARDAAQKAI